MEIAPNVRCVVVGPGHNNVYLVTGERAAFIDSGHDDEDEARALVDAWIRAGSPDVAAILLTHRHLDHIGGASMLADATQGVLMATEEERPHIEARLSGGRDVRTVADGDTVDLGGSTLEIIHSPGHTMGSLCVFYREQSVLFTGDTVLGSRSTSIDPEQGDMRLYVESLRRLLTYRARIVAPGHGPVIEDPEANIQALIERRLRRERQIVDALGAAPNTIEQLLDVLYPDLEPGLRGAAARQLASHLLKLEREDRVRAPARDGGRYALGGNPL